MKALANKNTRDNTKSKNRNIVTSAPANSKDIIESDGKRYQKLHGNLFGSVLTKSQWD